MSYLFLNIYLLFISVYYSMNWCFVILIKTLVLKEKLIFLMKRIYNRIHFLCNVAVLGGPDERDLLFRKFSVLLL